MRYIPTLDLKREYEYMKETIDIAIKACLEHQRWILGPEVEKLEEKVGYYIGTKHAVGVASGTDALLLSLRAVSLKLTGNEYFDKKDIIITTGFTFAATGEAILRSGATPLFVDINPKTYNIDTEKIRDILASAEISGVIGIIPVHLYGQACNMDEIMNIAKEHNLFILEDVAQAFGGKWKEKKLGSFGEIGAFSFFPSKNLGGFGDGGMVTTNDDSLAEFVKILRKHGGKDKYNVKHIGYNARLDTLQAAVLIAKMNRVEEFNIKRRNIADCYNKNLKGIKEILLPGSLLDAYHVYNQYTLRFLNNRRNEVQNKLKSKGVSTAVYYPVPLHKMNVFRSRCKMARGLQESEKACNQVISIPIEPLLTEDEINYVSKTIVDSVCER